MNEFYKASPTDDLIPLPNVESFKYEDMKAKILEAINCFNRYVDCQWNNVFFYGLPYDMWRGTFIWQLLGWTKLLRECAVVYWRCVERF